MKENDVEVKPKKKNKKKRKQIGKIFLFVVEIALLVVLAVGTSYVIKFKNAFDKIEIGSQFEDKTEAGINVGETGMDSSYIEEVLEGYTNIAIFGLDNRTAGKYNKGLSDVMMIASINNKTKEVKLVSVYRDTYLSIGDGKYKKANTAYSSGGVKKAVQMLNTNLDLDITKYVCVDWNAVVEAIDALGGVEVEVTKKEKELLNSYLWEIDKATGLKSPELKKHGKVTLNGTQATAYARIRYTSGGDFKRASRQRIVIEAMLNKAKQSDLNTLMSICENVFDDIATNITFDEIVDLVMDVTKYKIGISAGFPYELVTRDLSGSGDTVVAVDLEANVSKLHKTLFGTENYKPSFVVHTISQTIMDKTGVDENTKPYNTNEYDNISGADGTNWD